MDFKFNKGRVKILTSATEVPGSAKGVIYWMSRDQRVQGICSATTQLIYFRAHLEFHNTE
jgi:hypothetical protein